MYTISGKVLNKEANIGLPDLLIVLFDIDRFKDQDNPQTSAVERATAASVNQPTLDNIINSNADRLGSVITDSNGHFSFEVRYKDFNTGNDKEQKPDVILAVFTPEEPGLKLTDRLLYLSNDFRINAGHSEAYIIKISKDLLNNLGIDIPQSKTVEDKVSNYKKTLFEEKTYHDAIKNINKTEVLQKQSNLHALKKQLKSTLIPKPIIESNYSTFIAEDEKVSAKLPTHNTQELFKANRSIASHIAQNKGIEVSFVLNNTDREQLQLNIAAENTKSFADIRNSEPLKSLLYKMNSAGTNNLILTSNNPILKKCLSKSDDTLCASVGVGLSSEQINSAQESRQVISFPELPEPAKNYINGNNGGESNVVVILKIKDTKDNIHYEVRLLANIILYFDHSGISTSDAIPFTQEDIASQVKKVITDARSIKNSTNKPSPDSVNENINKFSLKKGPAELASFYDFKVLNIAFGHIWQQLIDDTPVQLAAEAKNHAINRGFNLSDIYHTPSQMMAEFYSVSRIASQPPPEVTSNFDITYEEWNALEDAQAKLISICANIVAAENHLIESSFRSSRLEKLLQSFKEQGELLIDYARAGNVKSFHKILTELDSALKSNYTFNIFGADETAKAINFGLLNTFRQEWMPVAYQVGDLVKSIPLSPKEERKYSLKTTFTRKHSEKESKKNNSSLTQEQNTTSRAEEEIVAKAQSKSNFNLSAEGNYSKWKVSSSLGLESAKESSQNKKDFRESVLKATQEFKEERSVEIDTEETYSSEHSESGTITNPNDELAVTYLFYELQKRFKVSEQLYRVMPVVLVAQDVPTPSEITEVWVIAHDWILNRSLLDDSFRPALQYIAQKNVGDDYAIREYRKNLRTQRQLIETLKRELASLNAEADNRYAALEDAISKKLNEEHDENSDGFITDVWESFRGKNKEDPETAKAREMAARDAQAYAAEKAQKMALNLQREVGTLQSITADYTKAMRDHLDKKTMVERLLLHIKSNIIYYMQAIWTMELPDQRYMRLLNVKVPQFEITQMDCDIKQMPEPDLFEDFRNNDPEVKEKLHKAWLRPTIEQSSEDKSLVEIADLDTILGFKGNYMVFPMKQHNAITEIMAMPYVDASFGAMDPDQLSNISLEDYSHYICCLRKELSESKFNKKIKTLKNWLEMLLADPLRNGDEIIVPTNSLYIEMMVSANSLLEDFKLQHREWDVYKVQEEVQMQALENLRMAKRILTDQLEDPKIDKKIVVEGNVRTHIDVDN